MARGPLESRDPTVSTRPAACATACAGPAVYAVEETDDHIYADAP
jgi:hypothetical protein